MIPIKAQKKIKTNKQMQDKENWAVIEHAGNEKISAGLYRICPCCHYPEKLQVQEIEALGKELGIELKAPSKIIIPRGKKIITS